MIDAYAALRHPFVRRFAIGRFAAIAGWQMINVAVGWQLYERTGDPWSLGLVGVVELAPVLLLMVVAGNAADRYPRRNVAIFAHGAGGDRRDWPRARVVAAADRPSRSISLLALIGTGRAFASPSVSTILPQLLAPAEFANANAWLSSIFQLAAISGPAIGGLLIAADGNGDAVRLPPPRSGQLVFIAAVADAARCVGRRRPAPRTAHTTCLRAFGSSATTRSFSRRSRSICLPCSSAARWRCCRSSRKTSSTSARRAWAGCVPLRAPVR